jgi:hypothetical protein
MAAPVPGEPIAAAIERLIEQRTGELLSRRAVPELPEVVSTDTIAEVIEKLCILHVRNWMLEDLVPKATNNEEYANLKRKCDHCNKIVRPRLLTALGIMLDRAILAGRSVAELPAKVY